MSFIHTVLMACVCVSMATFPSADSLVVSKPESLNASRRCQDVAQSVNSG